MRYLTTGEVAKRCQVSVGTVKNWIDARDLKAFRTPGGHFRIMSEELRRFQSTFGFLPETDGPRTASTSPRLLLVDDDRDSLDLLAEMVRHIVPKARIDIAADGYEALLKVGSLHPHVLLLDLRMSRLDGFAVCRRIKSAAETRTVKILAITGYDPHESREKALRAGADGFLRKPISFEELKREVMTLCARFTETDMVVARRRARRARSS